MTPAEATYRKARQAVERVLDEHMGQWEPIKLGVFLRACPEISTRSIEGALLRLEAEGRLFVAGRHGRHIVDVVDELAVAAENARRAALRAAVAAAAEAKP